MANSLKSSFFILEICKKTFLPTPFLTAYVIYGWSPTVIVWGMLATVIDSMFRAIFLAYFLSIAQYFALVVIPVYLILMLVAICIKKKEVLINKDDFLGTLISFGSSAYENHKVNYNFRSISKIVFAIVFIPSIGYLTYATYEFSSKFGTDDFGENNLGNATSCMNMCQKSPKSSSYCQNLWKHFEPSENLPLPEAHFVFLVTLGGLFLLSIVEDLIERFAKWGPYLKLYDYETKNGFQAKFLD